MGGVKITDEDNGYKAMTDRVFGIAKAKPTIVVGILSDEGEQPHGDDDTLTVLQVAIFNEFGTHDRNGKVRVPERSFLRAWFDEQEPQLRKDLLVLCKSVIAGKRTAKDILDIMGLRMVGQIQQRMADGIPPPNADSTIAKKGSSTPLIDHGILRSSVSYKIEEGG